MREALLRLPAVLQLSEVSMLTSVELMLLSFVLPGLGEWLDNRSGYFQKSNEGPWYSGHCWTDQGKARTFVLCYSSGFRCNLCNSHAGVSSRPC